MLGLLFDMRGELGKGGGRPVFEQSAAEADEYKEPATYTDLYPQVLRGTVAGSSQRDSKQATPLEASAVSQCTPEN
jgi:hypothetical protein